MISCDHAVEEGGQHTEQYNRWTASRLAEVVDVDPTVKFRIERDPLGEVRVPADAYYGAQTAARRRELPDQRPDRAAGARHRHRPDQEGGGRSERARSAGSTPTIAGAIVARGRRDPRRPAARSVRRRRLPGRRRHVAQHERERGARQPRRGDPRRRARRLHARAPERSRQHGAVDQRRVPDGDAAGAAARCCRPLAGAARAPRRRRSTAKSARVRRRAEDRPHAPAGRRADHARPGVRRLRRQRRARGRRGRAHAPSSCTS